MIVKPITVARIYTLEGDERVIKALNILRDEVNIMGATVLRGIEGMGTSREIHTSSLVDLSLELPLILEFYDEPDTVIKAIETLQSRLHFDHIVSWPGHAYLH
jgi:PII-like signaling protein